MIEVDARHHNLLFLFGLAPLSLGCSVGVPDDGTNFTSANPGSSPGDAAGDSTTAGDSDADDGTTGAADDSASASVSVSASASASVSVGDDGSTSGASASASLSVSASASVSVGDDYATSYGPPPGGSACEAYAYVIAACYFGGDPAQMAMVLESCEGSVAYYYQIGPACASAFEEIMVCISMLSCAEQGMVGMPGFCDQQIAALNAACM